MKREVRPIDANALARNIREYMGNYPNATARLTACRAILSMLGDERQTPTLHLAPTGDPLTLEQLREMDEKPVWMKDLTGRTLWTQWIIFECHTDDGFIPRGGGYFRCSTYGKTWVCYSCPPAHIDREAWAPCGVCSCKRIIFRATAVPDFPSSGADFTGYARFCPKCGRRLVEHTKEG